MFNIPSLSIRQLERTSVHLIEDSHVISIQSAAKSIVEAGLCPIFSEDRIEGRILFTVVPYSKPKEFESIPLKNESFSLDEITRIISTQFLAQRDEPIPLVSKLMLAEYKKHMIHSCTRPSSLVVDLVDEDLTMGKMVDIGTGVGSNSIHFLKKGWEVLGIDSSEEALKTCNDKFSIPFPKLSLLHADITKISLEANTYDVALAVDVLPYLPNSELLNTLRKIQSCLKPNGIFIGTLFFSEFDAENSIVEVMKKMGATFYSQPTITKSLLECTGFVAERISLRDFKDGDTMKVIQFITRKAV